MNATGHPSRFPVNLAERPSHLHCHPAAEPKKSPAVREAPAEDESSAVASAAAEDEPPAVRCRV